MSQQKIEAQLTEIYTLQCRAGLNKEYYGSLLARYQSINAWMEIFIAAGTAGSGISALTVWNTEYGKIIWGTLTVVASFLAIAKPTLQLGKKVERFSKLYAGYSDIYMNLMTLISRVRRNRALSEEMIRNFEAAEMHFLELSKDDDPKPSLKLLRHCEEGIRKRHPPEDAWYPEPHETSQEQTDENVKILPMKDLQVRDNIPQRTSSKT